jgi:hypothetical protein
MNVEIGTKDAQFPEKEYKNGIFVAVCCGSVLSQDSARIRRSAACKGCADNAKPILSSI